MMDDGLYCVTLHHLPNIDVEFHHKEGMGRTKSRQHSLQLRILT